MNDIPFRFQVNLKDAKLQDVARQKVASRKAATSQPKYRDRASERRTLFNQPDVPLPDKDAVSVPKKRQLEGPQSTPTPPPPAQDDANVGNKLLKMMGWKEGSGLGSEGDGRVKPMSVEFCTCYFDFLMLMFNTAKQLSMLPVQALALARART